MSLGSFCDTTVPNRQKIQNYMSSNVNLGLALVQCFYIRFYTLCIQDNTDTFTEESQIKLCKYSLDRH